MKNIDRPFGKSDRMHMKLTLVILQEADHLNRKIGVLRSSFVAECRRLDATNSAGDVARMKERVVAIRQLVDKVAARLAGCLAGRIGCATEGKQYIPV